MEYGLLVIAAI